MTVTAGHIGESNRVGVMRSHGEYDLVLTQPVADGAYLFDIDGELTRCPTRYSVQVDHALHIDLPADYGQEAILDRFFWRFMNHSCEPNAVIRGRQVFALRAIEWGQSVTFHYNTTEYEMAEPFDCRCGTRACERQIRGFRYLSHPQRARLRPWLARHLLAVLDGVSIERAEGQTAAR